MRVRTPVMRFYGDPLPLPRSLTVGSQHAKIFADLQTYARASTRSIQSVRDCYPFSLECGGRLAPLSAELAHWLTILIVARRFTADKGASSVRSLGREPHQVPYCLRWTDLVRLFTSGLLRHFA
jgi:hypothetical protein